MDLITTIELAAARPKAEQAALAAGTSLPTGASQSARLCRDKYLAQASVSAKAQRMGR